jgi:hypothetical protein
MSALRPLRLTKVPGSALGSGGTNEHRPPDACFPGTGRPGGSCPSLGAPPVGRWPVRAKTLRMSGELVFSCGHKPALRYSLTSPWTTCLRLIRAVISIRWTRLVQWRSLIPGLVGLMLVVMPRVLGRICRRCRSPWISRWSRHSRRSVPIYRSAKEFAPGERTGVLMIRTRYRRAHRRRPP